MENSNIQQENEMSQETLEKEYSPPLTISAFFLSATACLGTMASGCIVAYPSPAIPDINSHQNPFHINQEQQSWMGSIYTLGALLGALLSGPLMDRLGRKLGIMIATLPCVIGWVIIASSGNLTFLYIGRIINGVSVGLFNPIVHVYIAETAPYNTRGMLLTITSVSNVIGNFYENCLGYFLSWNWLAIVSTLIPTFLMCLMYKTPESPRYLLMKGKMEEAADVLLWLREDSDSIPKEITEIQESIKETLKTPHLKEFFQLHLLKPLLICLGIFTVQQFSGTGFIRIYTVSVFDDIGMTDSKIQAIVFGLVSVAGTMSSAVLIDYIGRKSLLVASSVLMAVCLAATGVYLKMRGLNAHNAYSTYLHWLPVICLVINNFSYALAYDPIPLMITSELFPTRARGLATSIGSLWQYICAFIVSKSFVHIANVTDNYGAFWISASVCTVGAIFIVILLPETKRKSLERIEIYFQRK